MAIDPTPDVDRVREVLAAYDVGEEIGRGSFGVVWSAVHRQLRRPVAIKQLSPALSQDPAVRRRFAAEARVVASLDHPHIVPVYDYVEMDGLCLLVMELLTGGTVADRLVKQNISMEDACAVAIITASALNHAHDRGILHRDVKPDNLLFSHDGTLKITDFGIAKVIGGADTFATGTGSLLGTPAYMAPEQAEGLDVGAQADVYAAGVVLYELLGGRLPFSMEGGALAVLYRRLNQEPRPLRDVQPAVPQPIAAVVMRALERSPGDRFESAADFGAAVKDAAALAWGGSWLDRVDRPLAGSRAVVTRNQAAPGSSARAVGPKAARLRGRWAEASSSRRPRSVAVMLTMFALGIAFTGVGAPALDRGLARGASTVAGADPARSGTVRLDLEHGIPVRIARLPVGVTVTEARLRFSVAGVRLGASAREPLTESGGVRQASLDARASRYVAVGTFTASLDLFEGDRVVLSHDFRARSARSGFLSVPGVGAIIVLALVVAYAESLLRPLRQGRTRLSGLFGMALVGAGGAVVIVTLPWLLALARPTPAALLICMVLGAGAGVAAATAVSMTATRRLGASEARTSRPSAWPRAAD